MTKSVAILLCLLKTIIKPSAGIETGVAMVLPGFAWFCFGKDCKGNGINLTS